MPHRIARGAGTPSSTANLVMTMLPSAMTTPHDRSMPAVRMISVWPIAITPTTITCCRISDRFSPLKKRSVVKAKKMQAISSAMKGPSWPHGMLTGGFRVAVFIGSCFQWGDAAAHRGGGAPVLLSRTGRLATYFLPQHSEVPVATSLLSTPATALLAISVTPVSV